MESSGTPLPDLVVVIGPRVRKSAAGLAKSGMKECKVFIRAVRDDAVLRFAHGHVCGIDLVQPSSQDGLGRGKDLGLASGFIQSDQVELFGNNAGHLTPRVWRQPTD